MGDYEEKMLVDTYPTTEEEEIEQEKARQKRLEEARLEEERYEERDESVYAEEQPDFNAEEEQTKDLKEMREQEIENCKDEIMLVFKLKIKPTEEAIKNILYKYIKEV